MAFLNTAGMERLCSGVTNSELSGNEAYPVLLPDQRKLPIRAATSKSPLVWTPSGTAPTLGFMITADVRAAGAPSPAGGSMKPSVPPAWHAACFGECQAMRFAASAAVVSYGASP